MVGNYIWISEKDLPNKDAIINKILSGSITYKNNLRSIYQIYKWRFNKMWPSMSEIHKSKDYNTTSVSRCLNNKSSLYRNCWWLYEEDYTPEHINLLVNKCKKSPRKNIKELLNSKEICLDDKYNTSKNKEFLKTKPTIYQYKNDKLLKYE